MCASALAPLWAPHLQAQSPIEYDTNSRQFISRKSEIGNIDRNTASRPSSTRSSGSRSICRKRVYDSRCRSSKSGIATTERILDQVPPLVRRANRRSVCPLSRPFVHRCHLINTSGPGCRHQLAALRVAPCSTASCVTVPVLAQMPLVSLISPTLLVSEPTISTDH